MADPEALLDLQHDLGAANVSSEEVVTRQYPLSDRSLPSAVVSIRDSEALVAAVRDEPAGSRITISAGTYQLDAPLEPKAGMTLPLG